MSNSRAEYIYTRESLWILIIRVCLMFKEVYLCRRLLLVKESCHDDTNLISPVYKLIKMYTECQPFRGSVNNAKTRVLFHQSKNMFYSDKIFYNIFKNRTLYIFNRLLHSIGNALK